jgi:indole-3-glycerol phosphate synthase/phosphoribosylanthranilate isomerase
MTAGGPAGALAEIVDATRAEVAARRARESAAALERRASEAVPRGYKFLAALRRPGRANVIAECKRRSPSRGELRRDYDAAALAVEYERGGAVAISVLTEPHYFGGSLDDLAAVRRAVQAPVLRKDFIVDEYQLFEARAAGADAVLLIVAALGAGRLHALHELALDVGLAALVEVHGEGELGDALEAGARLIGVNNRDLRTLAVDVETSMRLAAMIPPDVIAVSESGVARRADVRRLAGAGYRAFLVGEHLVTDADPARAVAELTAPDAPVLKVCGITRLADALHAAREGATAVGFVFWPKSPRYVAPQAAREIVAALPPRVTPVGVFVNATPDEIRDAVARSGVRAVQLHGDEPPAYSRMVDRPVLRAVTIENAAASADAWPASATLLLDASDPVKRGGTGRPVDWARAAELARTRAMVLAGGLTPLNVADAISIARPVGVDVSSGVESEPGVKDHHKLSLFLENARAAFAAHDLH